MLKQLLPACERHHTEQIINASDVMTKLDGMKSIYESLLLEDQGHDYYRELQRACRKCEERGFEDLFF